MVRRWVSHELAADGTLMRRAWAVRRMSSICGCLLRPIRVPRSVPGTPLACVRLRAGISRRSNPKLDVTLPATPP